MFTVSRLSSTSPVRFRIPLAVVLACAAGAGSIGCDGDHVKPSAKPTPAAATSGLAILGSDFSVTSISLYDPAAGTLLADGCVHSDASGGGLAQPLSGDVVLPTQAQAGGELVAIDRKNAVLTFVDPTTCLPRTQISVSTGGFKANPRDIISVSAHKAYVTRYETNATPTADAGDFDEGDDLLVIDPQAAGPSGQPILKRIALGSYAVSAAGTTIQARPDRGVFVGGKVYVTLGNLNGDLDVASTGRVVVIDPTTDTVTKTIDMPPTQKGCSAIEYVASTNRIYVSCGGSFSEANQAAGSGLVEIDLAAPTLVAKLVVPSSAVGNLPLNFSYAAILDGTAYVGTFGVTDFSTGMVITPDAFYAVKLATGTATKLLEGGAFNFGRANVDPSRKQVYLPDGDAVTPRVHTFDAAVDPPVALGTFAANPSAGLAPREIAWY